MAVVDEILKTDTEHKDMQSGTTSVVDMIFKAGTKYESIYSGDIKNGLRYGKGKLKWTAKETLGNEYEGEWYQNY